MSSRRTENAGDTVVAGSGETPVQDLSFEAALAELEGIVHRMEGGRLPLEESLAAYARGNALLRHCQQRLSDAEQQVQILDKTLLRDFEADRDEFA